MTGTRTAHAISPLLVVLDLDETLVYASESELGRPPDYATQVLTHLFGDDHRLEFVWCVERCTYRFDPDSQERHAIKKLHKLRRRGCDLARVVVVDDTPEKHIANYGNLVTVTPFEGDPGDDELPDLLEYLRLLTAEPNVRAVEKRGWRRARAGLPGTE